MEQRAVIQFCVDIGKTPTETHKFIKQSATHSNVSRSLVFKWHKRFSDGRGSLMDDKREGRPSFKTSDVVKNEVRDVIDSDRRLTVREVADKCVISKTTVHEILVQELHTRTLYQMNGVTVFSKLDLTQSFHQIELEESSRYITTFVCHKGLYRYKRLMFGINSAPELHQRIIQQTIQDIPKITQF